MSHPWSRLISSVSGSDSCGFCAAFFFFDALDLASPDPDRRFLPLGFGTLSITSDISLSESCAAGTASVVGSASALGSSPPSETSLSGDSLLFAFEFCLPLAFAGLSSGSAGPPSSLTASSGSCFRLTLRRFVGFESLGKGRFFSDRSGSLDFLVGLTGVGFADSGCDESGTALCRTSYYCDSTQQ